MKTKLLLLAACTVMLFGQETVKDIMKPRRDICDVYCGGIYGDPTTRAYGDCWLRCEIILSGRCPTPKHAALK